MAHEADRSSCRRRRSLHRSARADRAGAPARRRPAHRHERHPGGDHARRARRQAHHRRFRACRDRRQRGSPGRSVLGRKHHEELRGDGRHAARRRAQARAGRTVSARCFRAAFAKDGASGFGICSTTRAAFPTTWGSSRGGAPSHATHASSSPCGGLSRRPPGSHSNSGPEAKPPTRTRTISCSRRSSSGSPVGRWPDCFGNESSSRSASRQRLSKADAGP